MGTEVVVCGKLLLVWTAAKNKIKRRVVGILAADKLLSVLPPVS